MILLNAIATPTGVGKNSLVSLSDKPIIETMTSWNSISTTAIVASKQITFSLKQPITRKLGSKWCVAFWLYQKSTLYNNVPLFLFNNWWQYTNMLGIQISDQSYGDYNTIGSRVSSNYLQLKANTKTILNKWVHVLLNCYGNKSGLYIDGKLQGETVAPTQGYDISYFTLYYVNDSTYIDDLFVTIDDDVVQGEFTPKSDYWFYNRRIFIDKDKKVYGVI